MKTSKLVITALLAATVTVGKLALSFLPNVEVVTLLLALYGYVFGWMGIVSAFLFVTAEMLIWGAGTWAVSYYIYWPLVALIFMVLRNYGVKNRFILAGSAVAMTAVFGVLTSAVDLGLFSMNFENFGERFVVYYLRGVPYYLTQIICNAVLFVGAFPALEKLLCRFKKKIL